ncbi:hypothetical protein H6G17_29365 [Chroococcidiopsis sp. FACHB-1243]|uniref:hypothetical protein n=1 Tax=Chroococcidiopsis sp. [FACHB-1243] TaxID=2692781 RepID=UPI001782EBD3|nr:hypothetical protein [Chroococcidiopsis sp. [FACHB-1243]]MBD2309552.1 hypothetical protein [Chroococcidiopsis sp. [FACHB-1243]]
MSSKERDWYGRFTTDAEEASLENFSFRVPASLKKEVKRVAGKRTAEWLRQAIAEKLEREQQASA